MKQPILLCGIILAGSVSLPHVGLAAGKAAGRISPAQARAAALKRVHGTVLSNTYENEDGRWQYAMLVRHGRTLDEVQVDAKTGRVANIERTTPQEEAREAAADKKAAHKRTTR